MNAILLGNDQDDLNFEECLTEMPDLVIAGKYEGAQEAQKCLQTTTIDLVVLYDGQPEQDRQELREQLAEQYPQLIVLYITQSGENLERILHQRHTLVLLKPYTRGEIEDKLEMVRLLYQNRRKRIYARTFGYFDLFVDGKPVMFKSAKAKELLAMLIDRQGGTVDSDQIIATLWGDRPKDGATQSLCSKLCKTLQQELKEYDIEELLITSRGNRRINLELLDCDLYDLLAGKEDAGKRYYGEYMTEYDWAVYRNYSLAKYV